MQTWTQYELTQAKAAKEAYGKNAKGKMQAIGDVLATKREYSLHETVKLALSLGLRHSNNNVKFISAGLKNDIIRILKLQEVLQTLHSNDQDIYAPNLLEKYKNWPRNLDNICYATFASTYENCSKNIDDPDDIGNYTTNKTSGYDDECDLKTKIVKLQNNKGKMR